jgi:hypothetical protein
MEMYSLTGIDTSYWLTKDKAWMAARKAQWPAIERFVEGNRRRSEVNVIKQYFLRGTMPKWEKYWDWGDNDRHVDVSVLLWLHPSNDPCVLKPLFNAYIESDLIHPLDVIRGYSVFMDAEFVAASSSTYTIDDYIFRYMGKKNIIVFRILFEDIAYVKEKVAALVVEDYPGLKGKFERSLGRFGYVHFLMMSSFLITDKNSFLIPNCLYQYDEVLDWCLKVMLTEHARESFLKGIEPKAGLYDYQKGLYRIHHFNTEEEGDTIRTRLVHKIRKMLDEHDFIPEFKKIWEDVKADKVDIKNPWKP